MIGGYSSQIYAGFLEMPEITEIPELERKSMLKDLDIPSVRERDPDPESGPRLNVLKFKLQGIVEFPELGIRKSDIDKLIEDIRYDLMQEYDVLESGFTKKETDEVSKLLVEIEEETIDRHVSDVEVQKLIWLVREQRSKRGITLGQIETVADRITQFYRERGFILAKAYIPEQQVRDGVVALTLLLGMLGEVKLQESNLYSPKTITSVFDDYLAKPVVNTYVEENLYLINDFPGISVTGFFEPGEQVGDTRLQLNVVNETQYQGFARLDNHGSEQTGEYRLYAEGSVNNLADMADQLTIGVLSAFSPSNTTYGQLRYSASVFSPRLIIGANIGTNQFVLGQGPDPDLNQLELSGDTQTKELSFTYKTKRSRVSTHSVSLIASNIISTLESGRDLIDLKGLLDNEVDSLQLNYAFDVLDEKSRKLHQGNLSYLRGDLTTQLDIGKDEKFSVYSGNYMFLSFWKVPFFEANTRLLSRTSFQYSGESLSSINQYSIAGPTLTKAYPLNTFSADSAIYTGLEWIFDKPELLNFMVFDDLTFNELVQTYLFIDASYGIQKSLIQDEADIKGTLIDWGVGFRFNYLNNFSGNLQLAVPMKEDFNSDSIDIPDDNLRVVFDFHYIF